MAPGAGKSRVAHAVALYACFYGFEKRQIHFVYPSEHLKERDREAYANLWDATQMKAIHYRVGITFAKGPSDLLIVDEADSFMFQDPKSFQDFIGANPMLCFTATTGGEKDTFEERVCQALALKMVKDDCDTGPKPPDELILKSQLDEYLDAETRKNPVLLYMKEAWNPRGRKAWKDSEIYNVLNNLEMKCEGKYPLMVASWG